jgi:porin
MKMYSLKTLGLVAGSFAAIMAGASAHAGEAVTTAATTTPNGSSESLISDWWNGKYATGNWFGVRDTLADHGLTLGGKWVGDFYGVVDGGKRGVSGGFFDEEISFNGELNFGKLLNVDALNGLTAFGSVRWRDGLNPNNRVGASGNFQPSHLQSGKQWRLTSFGLTYSQALFGQKNFLVATGGWLQPQKEFIDQPLSKLFVNNTFESSKGIGGNIPFSSSFSTWGGTLKINPTPSYYAKAGLFMSYPQQTSTANHGLAFEGFAQDPEMNGLFAIAEAGWTPKFSEAELPGKYAFGGYYYQQQNNSFFGTAYDGFYGFYWQADQMLFRESSPEVAAPLGKGPSDGKTVVDDKSVNDGKSFQDKVLTAPAALSDQGLYAFNLITFAPKYNNILPFYFHTGLVYKGLIPTRNNDQLMAAFGFGQYSFYNIEALQANGNVNQPNYSAVLELDYRIQVNKWAYFQPYFQYIIQPNGTGAIENASILGFQTSVLF